MASVQTPYVLLAFQRSVEMVVVSELVWNLVAFIAFASHVPTRSCSLIRNAGSLLLLALTWNFLLVTIEKVPFDIVEAESELIDGVTTEFAGYAFSLVYAAEVTTGFLILKFFMGNAGFVMLPLFAAIVLLFFGRAFLARILMVDLLEHAFSVGLILTVVLLTVGARTRRRRVVMWQRIASTLSQKIAVERRITPIRKFDCG
jgi:NADH:ubiquinone oxidoreductase subunit H